ncbi:MAG TPA: HlyD family secretion protein [Bacteroidia bacterium]
MTKTENKKRKLITRIVLIVVLALGTAWGVKKYLDAQKFETTDDAQVETDISPVSARISGYISEIRFSDNQKVNKGDTLVLFDNKELKIKIAQSEAALQNAMAAMDVAKANSAASAEGTNAFHSRIDELKIRLDDAEKELSRYKNLLVSNAGTQQQYDKAKSNRDALQKEIEIANDQLNEAQKKYSAVNEQVKVAESVVKQKKSDLEFAQLQYSYSVVLAPCSGTISKKGVQVGQYVQVSQSLCAIVAGDIWIVANFKETQLAKMKEKQEVEIEVDAFEGSVIKGNIESFSSATGSKFSLIPPDNASGNYVKVVQRVPVKIELEKSSELYKKIKPGMSVFVKVILSS